MAAINSEAELQKIILCVFEEVIDEVANKILDELKNNIDEIVYEPYERKVYYNKTKEPTYQFRESWVANTVKKNNGVDGIVEQDPTLMEFNPDTFLHGSYMGDTRDILAQYIFEGTDTSVFGRGWWSYPRDAFSPTVKLLTNGIVDRWIISACKSRGLNIKKTMSFADWVTKYSN